MIQNLSPDRTGILHRVSRRAVCERGGPAIAGLVLAACGQISQREPSQPAQQPTVAVTMPPATVNYIKNAGNALLEECYAGIFATFRDKYPTVKVELTSKANEAQIAQFVIAAAAGGETYDAFLGHFTTLSTLLQAGVIQPLNPFLARDREVKLDDFYPAATEVVKGNAYGLAWFTNGKELWYNADLTAQAGVTSPKQLEKEGKWTWDGLVDLARKLTRTEGSEVTRYGFNYQSNSYNQTGTFVHSLWAWGADWFDKGFTKATVDAPEFLAAVQFAYDMITRHKVAGGGKFEDGSLVMMLTGSYYTRTVEDQIMRQNPFKVEMTLLPKGPAGRAVALANNANYIHKNSKVPEVAWLLYKHFLSKEAQQFVAIAGGGRYTASKKVTPTVRYPYEDADVYKAAAAVSRPTPLIVKQADLNTEWRSAWTDMVEGKRGIREALIQVQDRATQLLKDGGCIC